MRRLLLLIVLASLLAFGCIEEKAYAGTKAEQTSSANAVDLDGDGLTDYAVYDFTPVTVQEEGMKIQRQVTVSAQTSGGYTSINPDLTDLDLLQADQLLDEFSKSRIQSDSACSNSIGLMNIVCNDVVACSRLCSSASIKCKKIAASYDDVLTGSMISYVKDNDAIRSLLVDARRMAVKLRGAPQSDQDAFLQKTRDIIYRVASINANPLYTNSELGLCSHSDFGIPYVVQAVLKIGNSTAINSGYKYRVVLSAKPTQQKTSGMGVVMTGISLTDALPKAAVPASDAISSIQSISAGQDATNTIVNWSSTKMSPEGYLLIYEFTSDQPPENVVPYLKSPGLKVRKANLAVLGPTNEAYVVLNTMLKNYYMALGLAIGITIAAVFILYNIVVLGFTVISEKAAGASIIIAFRRAFGRTDVRWRTDAILTVLLLGGGVYVAMSNPPATAPVLFEVVDALLKNEMGLLATGLIAIGTVLFYLAVDNFVKITVLERVYGMTIKQEKGAFLAKAATLKSKIAELNNLINEYSKDDFDVSKEYDILTSLKAENVDNVAKEMTARSRTIIEDNLLKAEGAINNLTEKRKIADDNWPKWKEIIAKGLAEKGEVYVTSLVTIPASLRTWALGRYTREEEGGLVLERDVLRRKQVSAEGIIKQMINNGLLRGAIVIKQEKIVTSEFSEAGSTVTSALVLKLRSYLQSLAKNIGQHQPQSLVSIGDKTVLVLMKGRNIESALIVNKPKFNEAIEQWKAASKALEG